MRHRYRDPLVNEPNVRDSYTRLTEELGYELRTILPGPSSLLIHNVDSSPLIPGNQTDAEELRDTSPGNPRIKAADRALRIRGILEFIYGRGTVVTAQAPEALAKSAGLPYGPTTHVYLTKPPYYHITEQHHAPTHEASSS